MDEWYEFDEEFWDEYYGGEDDMNLVTLANDLAEAAVPDINWSVFDENPTSRDLQLFDWEDDWILFEFDHDDFYDTKPSSRLKSTASSAPQSPLISAMDEDTPQQQQFHHGPVPVSAKDAAAIAAQTGADTPIADDTDDGLDGGLRKKRPDVQLSSQQPSQNVLDKKSGQTSRSQSNDRSGSTGSRSRRSRTPIPNPNTGPQPDEEVEVIHEDDEKKVVIVHTGGILGKLRVIRKDTALQAPALSGGPGPSPLRNALTSVSELEKASLVVDAPTPK
ncbi:hypothetical protein ABW20_dc0102414 [Dactylellina cionopaga]|nr:hypothetical protein ABW20_dc0102414 [Dactylellina cionopaga]